MVDRALVERKLELSRSLADQLAGMGAPLLAAYWELVQERDGWVLYLVPKSADDERKLGGLASQITTDRPYRSVFSISDVFVDARQIARARAIGSYIRGPEDLGRRFDTTFTGGQYFESVIVVYLAPELQKAHAA